MAIANPVRTLADSPATPARDAGVLVVGGDYRGLGVVRSLGRRGLRVRVLSTDPLNRIAGFSRYCERHLRSPVADDEGLVEFLCCLGARDLNGWTLLPTGDETAASFARHGTRLSRHFVVGCERWDKLEWAYDKRITYGCAPAIGLRIPPTWYPGDREEVAALPCSFPVVLKPAVKSAFNDFVHKKGWIVASKQDLISRYTAACELVDPSIIMVQELIPGGGESQFSYGALCREGEPLASITARRTRQFPLELGRSSSYVETVENERVEELSRQLLRAYAYTGLVEVEFKYDRRDGEYKLLDVNPRVWGWHSLAQRAGVDLPYLYWRMLNGEPVEPARARTGMRWVRMLTDVPAAAAAIWNGSLPARAYLQSLRGPLETALFAQDDPLPFLVEVPLLATLALRRGAI